jgi:broad specificity phosphatase PhoE
MKVIDLRRHAARAKDMDALSPEGRAQAEEVGWTLPVDYAVIFVSPAKRAAETAAYFLRGSRQALPPHAVIPGLASELEDRWRSASNAAGSSRLDAIMAADPALVSEEIDRLATTLEALFERIPPSGRGLAVGHSPLIEAAVYGLTGVVVDPLAECQGLTVTQDDSREYRIGEQ